MKKALTTLILSLTIFTASADVLIYRASGRAKITVGGAALAVSSRGYWIVDPATSSLTAIDWSTFQGQKYYEINTFQFPLLFAVEAKGHSLSFLTESISGDSPLWSSSLYLKGRNQSLKIGTERTGNYPRTMSGTWRHLGPSPQGQRSFEGNLSLAYSQTMTMTNNDTAQNLQAVVTNISNDLENRGYVRSN